MVQASRYARSFAEMESEWVAKFVMTVTLQMVTVVLPTAQGLKQVSIAHFRIKKMSVSADVVITFVLLTSSVMMETQLVVMDVRATAKLRSKVSRARSG